MFLEPSNIRIIRHGLAGIVRIHFGSRVQPFMGFHVSIRKRDGTATIVIVGGDIPGRCLRAGIHHVYDKNPSLMECPRSSMNTKALAGPDYRCWCLTWVFAFHAFEDPDA